MQFDILENINPHRFYYEKFKDKVNEINKIIPIKKNDDDSSLFRFYYDDYLIHIVDYNVDLIHKSFVTIDLNMIREARRKGLEMIFIFVFNDDIYYWKFNNNELCVMYNHKENSKIPKYINVFTKHLNSLKIYQ